MKPETDFSITTISLKTQVAMSIAFFGILLALFWPVINKLTWLPHALRALANLASL